MQTNSRQVSDILVVTGRVLLALLFILAGLNKIMNYQQTGVMMTGAGLQPVALLLPLTIALELGGGVLLAVGRHYAALAALALAIFTVATNMFFHRFWEFAEPMRTLQLSLFFKNVAISGALLFAAGIVFDRRKSIF
jgi:putative oxidoreductase